MESKPGRYGIEWRLKYCHFHPGYRKTIANLRVDRTEVSIDDSVVRFSSYPFEPASIFPSGMVELDRIAEVNLTHPPQLRLKNGDILFVSYSDKDALLQFVNRNDVPIAHRSSVWSELLEPFLDTWSDQEAIDRQFARLDAIGLDREAVDKWRREVLVAMVAYNFGAFESFGMCRLLFTRHPSGGH